MNKIIITIIATLFFGLTQADYSLKYPLEASQGGNLPNGSIKINNTNNSANESQCELYSETYGWTLARSGTLINKVQWNGTTYKLSGSNYINESTGLVVHEGSSTSDNIVFEGFRYTKGEAVGGLAYGVCRIAI